MSHKFDDFEKNRKKKEEIINNLEEEVSALKGRVEILEKENDEIRKRSIAFSKALAKKSKKEHALLLSKITKFEQFFIKKLMNTIKQRTNLKKYVITLVKV